MTAETILQSYWDIFLSHLCEFYPLDKAFIAQYEYELDWGAISKNKVIDWDIEFLTKYENRFVWHELAWNDKILWTEDKINRLKLLPANNHDTQVIKNLPASDFEEVLNKFRFNHNQQEVYNKIFLPIINEQGVEKIFKDLFDYGQQYYFLEPIQHDIYGLTPEFKVQGDDPFQLYREGIGIFELNEALVLINGSLQEGPDRLYEVPRFSSFSYYTILLVSEHVRSILDQFRLPKHYYHEVRLNPQKITTSTKYYILQLETDTLSKDLDYSNRQFYYSYKDFENRGHGKVTEVIKGYDDLIRVKDVLEEKYSPDENGVRIQPDSYSMITDFDMYSYSIHGNIIVNQYLKDALEKNLPGQMAFGSAQWLRIRVDQSRYASKASLQINMKLSSRLHYKESEDDKFYYAKAVRLDQEDPELDAAVLEDDKFKEKEIELRVIFPKLFKNNYLNKSLRIKGYKLLPVSKFYIQHEYADRHPETYKSVVVAENGIGDSIHLILERDSDFVLQNRLFEFFHETGEYEEI
ncbi:hypothetical protein HB364_23240 [Pseudoflavitalea sp. X16]|uniref:hypothetical protein n=1 Tax=Paraflavitalea devenefica TaxID=2716334 RepID=UPI001420D58A|nr:hypothetical protein [Paraflavitalea devenefica]NII28019.1 hypothetical protein [Paraflavitalea devenefica]